MAKIRYLFYRVLFKTEYYYLFATPHWVAWTDYKLEKLHLEKLVAGREKFEGYRIWLRTHFGDFLRDVLLRPNSYSAQFFNRAATEQVIARHLAGTHNYLNDINKMLTIELLCSSLAIGPPRPIHHHPRQFQTGRRERLWHRAVTSLFERRVLLFASSSVIIFLPWISNIAVVALPTGATGLERAPCSRRLVSRIAISASL